MAYTDLAQVKLKIFRGAPVDPALDPYLQYLIDAVCATITSVIGDLTKWTKTDNISHCDIKCDGCCCQAYLSLRIRNIASITTIDGNAVDPADVLIAWVYKDRVQIKNINLYTDTSNDFCNFDVVYEAGYDPIPADLAFMAACLVEQQYMQSWGKDITSEKLGPRTVSFGNIESEIKSQFPNIMNLYTKVQL